ncbi:MAG: S49 family peptidase [Candidatus Doudnabacteria bacterium]|nr:S49 family peptidase [Candidatus Doudnabacteria bacterium]
MQAKVLKSTYVRSILKRVVTIVVVWNVVVACIVATLLVGSVFIASSTDSYDYNYSWVYGYGTYELLSIPVRGVITGTEPQAMSLFSATEDQTAGYTVKDRLYTAAEDPNIKGVILEIDSPGGTIYGSRAIADGVNYYRKTARRPVYAHISGTGASGAYWSAISTDKVFMDSGSDAGSIGVIMGPFEYYDTVTAQDNGIFGGGVVTQKGIESVTITAGKSKDIGNPYRRLTQDELTALQQTVNNEYDTFVRYVSQRRLIPEATIRNSIGAMTYDTKTAVDLRLVDGAANRQEAYDALAKAAGVEDDYQIIAEEYTPSFVESLLYMVNRKPQAEAKKVNLCTLTSTRLAYHGDITKWCV